MLIAASLFALMALTTYATGRTDLLLKLAAPALPLWLASHVSPSLRFYMRLAAYVVGLGMTAAWGVVAGSAFALIGKSHNTNWLVARSFIRFLGPLLGISFEVEGKEHLPQPGEVGVIVGNHQTLIDILYLGAFFPKRCSIMAKKSLRYSPFLGQFMSLSNAVWVDRTNRKSAVAQFAKVGEVMRSKGVSIFIFPEGTRSASETPALLPFKKGAFHLAVQSQTPIFPVVCENYARLYSTRRRTFEGGDLVIRILPRIPTEGYSNSSEDIAKLSDKVRTAMLDALNELAQRRGGPAGDKLPSLPRNEPKPLTRAADVVGSS